MKPGSCAPSEPVFRDLWTMARSLFAVFSILVLIPAATGGVESQSKPIFSGEEISFVPEHPCENCTYIWTASDGDPQKSGSILFNWTAPSVSSDVTVVITLTVENEYGCTGREEMEVTVHPPIGYPDPRGKIEVDKRVVWNGYPPEEDSEFTICIDNETWRSCRSIGPQGGVMIWDGLAAGEYKVTEVDPGPLWTVEVGGSKIKIDEDQGSVEKHVNVTNTHARYSKLRLTSVCSDDPDSARRWRVQNPNPYQLEFFWDLYGGDQNGVITVDPNGFIFFETAAVPGPNTVRIFVNAVQQDVKASGGEICLGELKVEKAVDWNGHLLDGDAEFEICLINETSKSCRSIGPQGGVIIWKGLVPGTYAVEESDPGPFWTVEIEGPKVTIDTDSGLSKHVNVTNVYSKPIALEPELEVYKTASPAFASPSDDVAFTITVENTGEVPLDLEVTDTLPAGISYVSADPAPETAVKNSDGTTTIFWGPVLGTLAPGNETTILLVGKVGEDIPRSASTGDTLTVLGSPDPGRDEGIPGEGVLWVQQFGGRGLADTIEGLIWLRVRLEVELAKMVELQRRFDVKSPHIVMEVWEGDLPGYTVHNYTNPTTGERLLLFKDGEGNVTGSEYHNSKMNSVLTIEYGPGDVLISESVLSLSMMERLRIDYDVPLPGYKVRTVTDYDTGDTLIETVNPKGEVIRRDYRKTPGIPKYKEFRLRNSVTATGWSEEGTASGSDYAEVTVTYLSDLKIKKVAAPIPAFVGAVIRYAYTVENTGKTTIDNLVLYDDRLDREIPLNRTALRPGEVAVGNAEYTVLSGDLPGPIINTAVVSGTDPQEDLIEDYDTATVPLYSVTPEIVLTKTPNKIEVAVGEVVTYSFVVENVGMTTVIDLTLFDDLLNSTVSLDRTVLDPGEVAVGTAEYTVRPEDLPGPVINNATAAGVALIRALGTVEGGHTVYAEDSAKVNVTGRNETGRLNVTKTALQKSVRPGDEVTYEIKINSSEKKTVIVNDTFSRPVEFVSADPWPSAVGDRWQRWYEETDEDGYLNITLVIRTKKQDFTFEMEQSVSGTGFVRIANDYNTVPPSYVLTNVVAVTNLIDTNDTNTTLETVLVSEAGTELSTREHGSGSYDSDEILRMRTENKSISMEKDVSATYAPMTLTLYNDRTVEYSSRWSQLARAKNRATGASMTEAYRYANSIDRESRFNLDQNGSVMEINSEFDGTAEIGFFKMASNTSGRASTPAFELREDYVGSFKVLQKVEEYGSSASSEKSAAGAGLVVGDRRIGSSQRSRESGTGTYDSEEIIKTSTNYIAKDISLAYAPMSQKLTDEVSIDACGKWKEGIYSKTPGLSYIGEEYSSIERLDKESVYMGLNEISTEADFFGDGRLRVVKGYEGGSGEKLSRPLIDFDETYSGNYSISRRILMTGVAKYDHPHISVSKVGDADANLSIAHYTITVTNDGNAALREISIEDTFPKGTAYLSSSRRPDMIAADRAIWSVGEGLSVGGVLKIDLTLDVTEGAGGLVNLVKASANTGNDTVLTATNFSVLEAGWLSCCPGEIFASKTAEVDPVLNNVVLYRLTVQNLQDRPIVARIEDRLPRGLAFLGSSTTPSQVDQSLGVITWVVADLKGGEIRTIEYIVEASRPGRYLNVAEVDPYTVDGEELRRVSVSAVVEVGPFDEAEAPPGCRAWVPPDWGFNHTALTCEMTCEELLSL